MLLAIIDCRNVVNDDIFTTFASPTNYPKSLKQNSEIDLRKRLMSSFVLLPPRRFPQPHSPTKALKDFGKGQPQGRPQVTKAS